MFALYLAGRNPLTIQSMQYPNSNNPKGGKKISRIESLMDV
jgi:hypothetical protein